MPPRLPLVLLPLTLACGGSSAPEMPAAAAPPAAPAKTEPAAKAEAEPPPPPAPPGTVRVGKILVQICAEPTCPQLVQDQGAEHCKQLKQGEGLTWRLPTLEEIKSLAGRSELAGLEGFHWTSTPFEEDDAQIWIFDPVGGQSTTIPPDRKPFTIRCVAEG